MTQAREPRNEPSQPPLSDLLGQYLKRQADAHTAGLGLGDMTAEVVPFEAVPASQVDPRLAWDGALAALRYLRPGFDAKQWSTPADWPHRIRNQESVPSIAFCVGNFPQMIKSLQPLLGAADYSKLCPAGIPAARFDSSPEDIEFAGKPLPQTLLALGLLRLARRFDDALNLAKAARERVPGEWREAWANEEAALAWHSGRANEAIQSWQAQAQTVPVLFNRGMAALFSNQTAEARSLLTNALSQLPEEESWHHLGRLYLALAEMRR